MHTSDHTLWLLIGLCVALVATLEVVEEAVEGAWPHQRRTSRMNLGQRRAHQVWALVAIMILPAGILAVLNVVMMVWKDVDETDALRTGGLLLGVAWITFILANVERLRLRGLIARAGAALPVALVALLVVAIVLLLSAFLDVRPGLDTIRDAIPYLNED